ncbi:conserved hypothetical protein [Histoplasma capsulatum var. duboisii H88]|uniref:Uncharacterized protein n=1 Tax=Ajellomyces capsulatus (strain H88) TaxID=544711 RepID=F0UF34_AJEC8|nr:conserved hypothetical protein [Histoplasma capsulatum var. duboisii H88]QSS55671.1 hypothetical protein I7I53_03618 [Histoplasma capsulatum var. duboisii H88]
MPEPRTSPNHTSSQPVTNLAGSASYLRHRALNRAEPSPGIARLRRSSTFSDTVSEARNSIRSSTDDLFLPRVDANSRSLDSNNNESHWQSVPLALALLPAVGGLLFPNGSAVVTDITLLVLAAVFLNWSIRLPWDWYISAQQMSRSLTLEDEFDMDVIIEQAEEPELEPGNKEDRDSKPNSQECAASTSQSATARAAMAELHRHELAALTSCFLLPIVGAWLLHTLRSQLSRPSEGLVSNYNLTVFLLAAEVRPFSHLLKMVQARTLYLQRLVSSDTGEPREKIDASKIFDISTRLEELEAHIAETASKRRHQDQYQPPNSARHGKEFLSTTSPATTKGLSPDNQPSHPDLSALTRAMRRYEKRTALHAHETETRVQSLEERLSDVISLSTAVAAQQRRAASNRSSPIFILLNWMCDAVTLPAQMAWGLCRMPFRIAGWCAWWCLGWVGVGRGNNKGGRSHRKDVGKELVKRRSNGGGSVNGGGGGDSGDSGSRNDGPKWAPDSIPMSRELMGSTALGDGRVLQREIGTGKLPIPSFTR